MRTDRSRSSSCSTSLGTMSRHVALPEATAASFGDGALTDLWRGNRSRPHWRSCHRRFPGWGFRVLARARGMTPSTRVEKSRGQAEKDEDRLTTPASTTLKIGRDDPGRRRALRCLHDSLRASSPCSPRSGDRGAGARGDRRPRLPAEPAGALVPATRSRTRSVCWCRTTPTRFRRAGTDDRGRGFAEGYSVVLCNSDLSASNRRPTSTCSSPIASMASFWHHPD